MNRKIGDIADFPVIRQDAGRQTQQELRFIKTDVIGADVCIAGQQGAAEKPDVRVLQRRLNGAVQHDG